MQYPRPGKRRPGQVVPDNRVVVRPDPIQAEGSYDMPLQPVGPYWVLEYVSKHNKRKDYYDDFVKYEKELKVPYYLLFYPEAQDLSLYEFKGKKYSAIPADAQGRHPIPKLELEVGLRDGWVRFWFRGKLLPLAADLQSDLDEARQQLQAAKRRARREKERADREHEARVALEREVNMLRARLGPNQG